MITDELIDEIEESFSALSTDLRMGNGLNPDALRRTLALLCRARLECSYGSILPKRLAMLFLDMHIGMSGSISLYSEADAAEIEEAASLVIERARECCI